MSRAHPILDGWSIPLTARAAICLIALGLLAAAALPSRADASAFYNNSENGNPSPAWIQFSCGFFCGTRWEIPVGGSRSYPGKGGAGWVGANENWGVEDLDRLGGSCEDISDKPLVSNHGWQVLHKGSGAEDWYWMAYDNNGNTVGQFPISLIKYANIPSAHPCAYE